MITRVGFLIMGIGLAVPSTLIVIVGITSKLRRGDNYKMDFKKVGITYLICLLGWILIFGIK